jgi:sugar/nucleoside kinase (ribokinase family)
MSTADAYPLLVVGSVALDSVETPREARDDVLGGAAAHFAVSAAMFAPVRLVGVVGEDFGLDRLEPLRRRNVDLAGLEVAAGPSFRWRGRYHEDMNHRDTLELQLGVFAQFRPRLPAGWEQTPVVFLANIDPDLQLHVLDQVPAARLTACDTIEHWIVEKRDQVASVISRVDVVFMNEDEARLYADTTSLQRAAATILAQGCRAVVVKKGEDGALLLTRTGGGDVETFMCASYPVEEVVDPTGAGDAFAGGVMGSLAAARDEDLRGLRRAVVTGTVVASYAVGGFGPETLLAVTPEDLHRRAQQLEGMTSVG